jgi:hypothetical protein
MIPANGAQHVHYTTDQGLPGPIRQVLAWDSDGHPMVLGSHGLERAADLGPVERVRQDAAAVVGAVSGGGWVIEYQDVEGAKWVTPILAWTVHADGSATPITSDEDGLTDDATSGLASYRVYHPDESCTRPEPPAVSKPWCGECNYGQEPPNPGARTREGADGRMEKCHCHPGYVSQQPAQEATS